MLLSLNGQDIFTKQVFFSRNKDSQNATFLDKKLWKFLREERKGDESVATSGSVCEDDESVIRETQDRKSDSYESRHDIASASLVTVLYRSA